MEPTMVCVCVIRPDGTKFYIGHEIEPNGKLAFTINPTVKSLQLKFKDGRLDTEASKDYLKFQKEFEELPEFFKNKIDKTDRDLFSKI